MSKQEAIRARVAHFYKNFASESKIDTVRHFEAEGISKRTIYNILSMLESRSTIERKKGSGKRPTKLTPEVLADLKSKFENQDNLSFGKAAAQIGCHKSHLGRTIKAKLGIKPRHKQKSPKYKDENQMALCKVQCGRLERKFRSKSVVLDDESYFYLRDPNSLYYSSDPSKAPDSIRLKPVEKYCPKVLVWLAGSERGLSEAYIQTGKNAMDSEIYTSKCLPKLRDFIQRYHRDADYLFWPDKATCHYSAQSIEKMNELGIEFVAKKDNPTNLPQARPIEDFWAILKAKVWATDQKPKTLPQLVDRIKFCLENFDLDLAQRTFASCKKRVRLCGREGVLKAIH